MNIAIFASAFYPHMGGVEELCRQLSHAYLREGHTVGIWTERWPRRLPTYECYENIPVHRFPMRVPASGWKAKLSFHLTHRLIRSRIARSIRQSGAEILHVQCVSSAALYALHVRKTLGIPLVVTLQGELSMDAAGIFQRPGIGQEIMRASLEQADAITACSSQTLREAEDFHGKPFGSHATVIYNGIDTREFAAADPFVYPRPYILAIGRHVREKGFDILLQAFALAGNVQHDLILAGDGPENADLRALTEQLGLAGTVHFPGRVNHTEAVRLFMGCSFFVLPSRHEPFGIVNLEAMAAGKAIVASRVGGVPEIVQNEEHALLVPPEDTDTLCRAIQRLAADHALRTRLGQAGLGHVRKFAWSDLAGQYQQIYRDLLNRAGPTTS